MNISQLRELIREEIHRVIEADIPGWDQEPDITSTDQDPEDEAEASLQDKLMQSPGAPFGGNLYQSVGPVISNEAREKLHNWFRLTKAAWDRYGAPQNWPENIVKLAQQTGAEFESKVGNKGTTQYK